MLIPSVDTLKLELPQLSMSGQVSIPKSTDMEQWIANLPVANTTETAKQLYRMLKNLNRMDIAPRTRLQLTELLVAPIDRTIHALENLYIDAVFPLVDKTKHIAFICTKLTEELAFAYKWIIQDVINDKSAISERNTLIWALFYALHRLVNSIYAAGLVYQPPPTFVWSELHSLFSFADANKLASRMFKLNLGPDNIALEYTLRDLYLRGLLFATSGSIRLRQREIRVLYKTIFHWTKSVHLGTIAGITQSDTSFIIKLDSDEPPQHSSLVKNSSTNLMFELDTHNLVQALQTSYVSMLDDDCVISKNSQRDTLSKATIQRLIQAWGKAPQRYFPRTRLNFELPLAVGLNAIYNLLQQQNPTECNKQTLIDNKASEDNKKPEYESALSIDGWDTSYMDSRYSEQSIRLSAELAPIPKKIASIVTPKDSSRIWAKTKLAIEGEHTDISCAYVTLPTLNESIGGYCIDWKQKNVPRTKIGELVGIPVPVEPFSCSVAVVRWMYDVPGQGLQVGVQMLAPDVKAINVVYCGEQERALVPCLMLPALQNDASLPNLIAPPLAWCVDSVEDLCIENDGGVMQEIRLVKLIEVSGAFARFSFAIK